MKKNKPEPKNNEMAIQYKPSSLKRNVTLLNNEKQPNITYYFNN